MSSKKTKATMISSPLPKVDKSSMIVYVGRAQKANRIGVKTGEMYSFLKDSKSKPISVEVKNQDVLSLLDEKGKGCVRHAPTSIFLYKEEYDELCGDDPVV